MTAKKFAVWANGLCVVAFRQNRFNWIFAIRRLGLEFSNCAK